MTTAALPLQQHPHFADALSRLGRRVRWLDLAGAHPVLAVQQFGQLFTSRGPVWRNTADADTAAKALGSSGLRIVNADRPDGAVFRAAGLRMITTAASVAELDLTGTPQDRLQAASGKWRNICRRAQEVPMTLTLQPFDPQRHRWLLAADLAQQRQKRFRAMPHAVIHAVCAAHPRDVLVQTACVAGTPVAAMLFMLHRPVVTYHLGWTNAQGRAGGAHHRMLMAAADIFAQRGFQRLDLGTVDTELAQGLARFKIGTGAVIRPLGGTWLRLTGRWCYLASVTGAKPDQATPRT